MNSSGYHTYPYMYVMGRTGDPQVLELFPYLSNIRWSVNGQSQYARFVIAATRFHLKHGRWPADVSELCPEFLECEFEEQTGRRWSVQMVAPFDYPDLRGASVGDAFNIRHIIDKEQRVPSSPEELQKLASRYGFGDISQVPFASFVPRPLFIEVYTTASFRDEAGEQVIVNVYQPPSAERLEQYRKFSSAGPSMATVHLTWNNEADMIGRMSELLSPQEEPHGKE
jgi:hypothetical protein